MLPQRQRRISAWHRANHRMRVQRLRRNQHMFDVGKTPHGAVVAQNAVLESLSSWLEVSPASRAPTVSVSKRSSPRDGRAGCWRTVRFDLVNDLQAELNDARLKCA